MQACRMFGIAERAVFHDDTSSFSDRRNHLNPEVVAKRCYYRLGFQGLPEHFKVSKVEMLPQWFDVVKELRLAVASKTYRSKRAV